MADLPKVYVHLLPSMIPSGALKGKVAVVVDVLRATTVMVQALAAGAKEIRPCLEIADARRVAASYAPDSAVLAGEREGLPIDGFDFGNSPGAFTEAAVGGKTVVMTTTNGTKAILAALEAESVYIAAFLNLAATVKALKNHPGEIHLIGSGTNGLVSWEDTLLTGAMVAGLAETHSPASNDEALLALFAWKGRGDGPLHQKLAWGIGGRRVTEIGLAVDIEFVSQLDKYGLTARAIPDPARVIRAGGETF